MEGHRGSRRVVRVFGVGLIVVLAAGAVAAPGPDGGRGGYDGGGGYGERPTPTPTPTATPVTTTPPPVDQTAPAVNSRVARGQTARSILRRGLRFNVQCNEDCRHVTQVFASRNQARKLSINRKARRRVLVGRRTTLLKANVAQNITVRLNNKAKRGIRRMRRARVRKLQLIIATAATDARNNVRRSSTTLSFKR
jgi:hypothetical protein